MLVIGAVDVLFLMVRDYEVFRTYRVLNGWALQGLRTAPVRIISRLRPVTLILRPNLTSDEGRISMVKQSRTIEDYVASRPADLQPILREIRRRIHHALPDAGEMISYGMPAITLDGRYVVYFAGWKHHVSIYPVPRGDEDLLRELAPYLSGKGTLKFPLEKAIPYDVIARVAAQLAAESHNGT
jgi:uncharacterized protein YdhG (YjbR/CyaY superfamily)